MAIIIECEHCGTEFSAERNSAKYCSDSCKTMACRARREEEQIEDAKRAEQDELTRFSLSQLERLKEFSRQESATFLAWQEQADKERHQELELERLVREKAQNIEREKRAKKHEKDMQEAERNRGIISLLGLGIIGLIPYVVEKFSKKPEMPGDSSTTVSAEQEATASKVIMPPFPDTGTAETQ